MNEVECTPNCRKESGERLILTRGLERVMNKLEVSSIAQLALFALFAITVYVFYAIIQQIPNLQNIAAAYILAVIFAFGLFRYLKWF